MNETGARVQSGQRGRTPIAVAALGLPIVAAGLVACGGAPAPAAGGSPAGAVNVHDVSGLGPTLVDATGKSLYFSDQEADGTVRCTDDCLGFWFPATVTDATAVQGQPAGIASTRRPDSGQQQLTFQGKPLYTFRLDDNAGQHAGDNLTDDFGGRQFTWHAATVGSAPAQVAPTPPSQGGGYGY